MMRPAILRAAVLLLPLAGLGWTWHAADRLSKQGTEWDVPAQGYDPRDLLQGHYVQFRYDWPNLTKSEAGEFDSLWNESLCLEGSAPVITRTVRLDPRKPIGNAPHCANYVAGYADYPAMLGGSIGGRLYASQELAMRLQGQLADPKLQGVIHIRLRPDGHVTPLGITFRPRPPQPAPVAHEESH